VRILLVVKSKSIETLGPMYLSAIAKKAGHECRIVEVSDATNSFREWQPDVVGYSVMTGDQALFKRLNDSMKKNAPFWGFDYTSIVGGHHPTFFPEDCQWADHVVQGEAEGWIAEFCGAPPVTTNLDSLPWPDRTDFPDMRIRDFLASRGCPHNCLSGDTIVKTINGNFKIKDLVGQDGIKVLSRDPITHKPLYADAIHIGLIKKNAEMVRVHFDDGTFLDCTPDHRLMVFKSKNQYISEFEWEVEAKDLKPKQQVRAVRFEVSKSGRMKVSTRRDITIPHARLVMEATIGRSLTSKEIAHHKDRNQANDCPDNLVLTTTKDHIGMFHKEVSERMTRDNPIKKMSREWLSEKGKKSFSGRKQSLQERLKRREMQLGEKNSNWKPDAKHQNKRSRIQETSTEVNHRILRVERLDYVEDVYCMEIPGIHWFYANDVLVSNCSYCYNDRWRKMFPGLKKVRYRDPRDVCNEVVMTDPEFAYFQDSCFGVDIKWMREFARIYQSEVRVPYHCHVRPEQCNEEFVLALHDSYCYSLRMGLEAASPKVRKILHREKAGSREVFDAVKSLRKWGIKVMVQNILGLPTATIEDDLDTLEANIRCQPTYAWCSIFNPYPGTELGDLCKKKGWYKGDYSDLGDSFFDTSPLEFEPEHVEQLECLQRVFALCAKMGYVPKVEELRRENVGKLVHKIMRWDGDRKLYMGVV